MCTCNSYLPREKSGDKNFDKDMEIMKAFNVQRLLLRFYPITGTKKTGQSNTVSIQSMDGIGSIILAKQVVIKL